MKERRVRVGGNDGSAGVWRFGQRGSTVGAGLITGQYRWYARHRFDSFPREGLEERKRERTGRHCGELLNRT